MGAYIERFPDGGVRIVAGGRGVCVYHSSSVSRVQSAEMSHFPFGFWFSSPRAVSPALAPSCLILCDLAVWVAVHTQSAPGIESWGRSSWPAPLSDN